MKATVYLNGKFIPESEAHISINDRGFLFGDGIFDTMRAYGGVPFKVEEHLRRLLSSAGELKYKKVPSVDELQSAITKLLDENNLENARVRITLTRGEQGGDLGFDTANEPTLLIVARPFEGPSKEDYKHGISVSIVKSGANPAPLAQHKTTSFLPYLLARDAAKSAGANEAIIVDANNQVLEAATANVFMVKSGEVYTPEPGAGNLPGIAQTTVMELMKSGGQKVKTEKISADKLLDADEVFLTNSLIEVLPVSSIDGKTVLVGEVTRKIRKAYRDIVSDYVRSKKQLCE